MKCKIISVSFSQVQMIKLVAKVRLYEEVVLQVQWREFAVKAFCSFLWHSDSKRVHAVAN